MKIRAISLYQPWASAVAAGAKLFETRSWPTAYRGLLAIHASKRKIVLELRRYQCDPSWRGALSSLHLPGPCGQSDADRWDKALPFGAIVALCLLTDCRRAESFTREELHSRRIPGNGGPDDVDGGMWSEAQMGDFSPNRFCWALEDVIRLPEPISCVGRQGFFSWEIPPHIAALPAVASLIEKSEFRTGAWLGAEA